LVFTLSHFFRVQPITETIKINVSQIYLARMLLPPVRTRLFATETVGLLLSSFFLTADINTKFILFFLYLSLLVIFGCVAKHMW